MFFIKAKTLTVIRTQQLTPNMKRITLGGKDLKGISAHDEGAYIKLFFEQPGEEKPCRRSYTVRKAYPSQREIDVDFVCHGDEGPASTWALQAKEGDEIEMKGPAVRKMVNTKADWFVLVGDMTSLPALSVNLEYMPATAKGYAVIEVEEEADKQELTKPEGVELYWIVNSDYQQSAQLALEKLQSCAWLPGRPYVWTAAEFDTMRAMRRYFKGEKGVQKREIYASSYWKYGETDEGNKRAKRMDKGA